MLGVLYETLLTLSLDGRADPRLIMLSLNDPDFFRINDDMLPLRFSDPNFSRSRTLPLLGDSSFEGVTGGEDITLGADAMGVIGGRAAAGGCWKVMYWRTILVKRSLISAV